MIVIPLQSGSNGNCVYVHSRGTGVLLDAGISGLQAARRLERFGVRIGDVRAIVLSHEHADHSRGCGVFHRKFALPLYATERTWQAARRGGRLGELADVRHFSAGQTLDFGPVRIETIPTAHDGVDGVGFVVCAEGRRLGVLTDLGHVFAGLDRVIASLDAVLLESNYDPDMLAQGPYPYYLKQRIAGPGGHLSNLEAARLLHDAAGDRLQWACLGHLSEQNNDPQLALDTHRRVLGDRYPLHVASRYDAVGAFQVE